MRLLRISLTDTCCRLLCHLGVGHGIKCSAVEMHRPLRWQPVHLSSVGWWLFWGFLGHALHPHPPQGGEVARTDKFAHYHYRHHVNALEELQLATILCGWLGTSSLARVETLVGWRRAQGALECCPFWWFAPLSYFCSLVSKSLLFNSHHIECMYVCMYVCTYLYVCGSFVERSINE